MSLVCGALVYKVLVCGTLAYKVLVCGAEAGSVAGLQGTGLQGDGLWGAGLRGGSLRHRCAAVIHRVKHISGWSRSGSPCGEVQRRGCCVVIMDGVVRVAVAIE